MPISSSQYVDVNSAVGGATLVPQRQLVGRLFTDNPLVPPNQVLQFASAALVGAYFGTNSAEYARAVYYFSFVSLDNTSPELLSFARWVDASVAPMIFGANINPVLSQFTSVSSGSFGLTIGGVSNTFSSLDFTAAGSLAAVAAILQTAIETASGSMWTAATVTFTNGIFQFVGGSQIAATISVQAGATGTDITPLIGWIGTGVILAAGSLSQQPADALAATTTNSDNFGSFAFMTNTPLTLLQNINAATWNKGQGVKFMFSVPCTAANAATWAATDSSGLGGIGGTAATLTFAPLVGSGALVSGSNSVTGLTTGNLVPGSAVTGTGIPAGTIIQSIVNGTSILLSHNATVTGTEALTFYSAEYPEMLPMMILAATNYDASNSVQNYMFKMSSLPLDPTVTDDATKATMDALRVNYYGQTQSAGALLSFYQNGFMFGGATDALDMNTYANEQWLASDATAAILNLQLSINALSAAKQGRLQVITSLQSVVNQAVLNGTISIDKVLTPSQKNFISRVTGDANAWYQVQTIGYWLNAIIVPSATVPIVYKVQYTLVYSKDDIIRKVDGFDDLI